jgi:hypothetical protein
MTAPTPDDLKTASQTAVLSGLNPQTVQTLLAPATIVSSPGDALFRQGEPAAAFFIVIEAGSSCTGSRPPAQAVLHVLTKGEASPGGRLRGGGIRHGLRRHRFSVVLIPAYHVMVHSRDARSPSR